MINNQIINSGVSIILCFYNAGEKLIGTLEHIKKLNIYGIQNVELILVDNNSNDNSCQIIDNLLSNFSVFPCKVISEPNPGLSNARIKGVQESNFDILLFCDDDNWLSPDFIIKGLEILSHDNKIAVLGGCGTAVSNISIPLWFEKNKLFYAVGEQIIGSNSGSCLVVYGAGMFVRKNAFLDIRSRGFKFYTLGRTGKKLSAGEDSELCLAFQIAGYKVWYDKSLTFLHYIDKSRLTIDYLNKMKMGISSSFVSRFYLDYFNGYTPKVTKWFWLKEFIYSFKDGCFAFLTGKKYYAKRSFILCRYLIKERGNYNLNAKNILEICNSLSQTKLK